MVDVRAGDDQTDADRLPWLEAVEDEEEQGGPSAGKLAAFVVIGIVAIGLIVGGLFWLGNRPPHPADGGAPELIAAPAGDYKVKPQEPGGMKVSGEGDTVFAASAGAEPKGRIDVNAVPETPVAKPTPAPKAAAPQAPSPPPSPKPSPSPTPKLATAPAATAGAGSIQLGAFSSEGAASAAWKALSGRFGYLAPLDHSVTPVTAGGRTLYRLRASGPGAADICGRLRVAGEQCVGL